jgi:hypothetical protein
MSCFSHCLRLRKLIRLVRKKTGVNLMAKRPNSNKMTDSRQQTRKIWVKPVVQKIKAGDAEVGTRSSADGAFTTS